ncbi:Pimeloyl-ACP methyl ester carboxylesterase [Amycolatopsis xylanica]|uniref:Pimeloyl-ACP methyl ester carboxylesterase n=2 Tax=Amycolatopsis xylanica TaxID=589385 RepID=A0A1H3DJU9_9PSEU|nr:Pimeloyl-ACP methyl ester carboxylesterase [Amycolatopsis xylanica]
MWNAVRAPLAAQIRVITPDQRGLGRSPLPETDREPSLDDAARDVIALLDKLELDQVVLGGCSMGGYLTQAVLRAAPDRVGGLVFIDTKATADAPEAAQARLDQANRAEADGIDGWLADFAMPLMFADATLAERPDLVASTRELIEAQPASGIAWAARAMAARPDSLALLRETDVPTLVLVGEHDKVTPVDQAKLIAEAAPNSTLQVLPDSAHLTPLEVPDLVSRAILEWYPRG